MNETIKLIIKYVAIKKYLMEELGYPKKDAVEAIKEIRGMTKNLKHSFLVWFKDKTCIPDIKVECFTLLDLMELAKMDPVDAFITLNWLTIDPEEALKALYSLRKDDLSDNTLLSGDPNEAEETDTSDITED